MMTTMKQIELPSERRWIPDQVENDKSHQSITEPTASCGRPDRTQLKKDAFLGQRNRLTGNTIGCYLPPLEY
jgi:hypothetical protein